MFERLKAKVIIPRKCFMGIDIGNRDIKIVEMKQGIIPEITRMGRIPTPQGALDDGAILQANLVANAIKNLIGRMEVRTRCAVTIVSGKHVITRLIKLPKMTSAEVASTLKWEAEKYIPLSNNTDVVIDHLILGNSEENLNPQINVLLVAAPRKLVYLINETFTLAGLCLNAVEIEPLSLSRSIGWSIKNYASLRDCQDEVIVGLDMGAKATNLFVFQDKKLLFSRYIALGGDMISHAVATSHGIEFNAGQVIKERDGRILNENALDSVTEPEKNMDRVLKESIAPLVGEIKRSIDFLRSKEKLPTPKFLVLSGGAIKLKGLAEYLRNELAMQVTIGFGNIPVGEQFAGFVYNDVKNIDPAYAVAIGLALREIAT